MSEKNHPGTRDGTDEDRVLFRVDHDWRTGDPISYSVIESVAAVAGTDPERLPPLYEVVDLEAMDRIFDPSVGRPHRAPDTTITFRYREWTVTVRGTGEVVISS